MKKMMLLLLSRQNILGDACNGWPRSDSVLARLVAWLVLLKLFPSNQSISIGGPDTIPETMFALMLNEGGGGGGDKLIANIAEAEPGEERVAPGTRIIMNAWFTLARALSTGE